MIRQIAPQFLTADMAATLASYRDVLGFATVGTWLEPPVHAIVERDGQPLHIRLAEAPPSHTGKYEDELLDAYLRVDGIDALFAEYTARGAEFPRGLSHTPWQSREFVVNDCDGRLLAFGARRE